MTSNELTAISELLENEKTLIAKFSDYASNTSDAALKSKYEQMAATHQQHLDTLYKNLK